MQLMKLERLRALNTRIERIFTRISASNGEYASISSVFIFLFHTFILVFSALLEFSFYLIAGLFLRSRPRLYFFPRTQLALNLSADLTYSPH